MELFMYASALWLALTSLLIMTLAHDLDEASRSSSCASEARRVCGLSQQSNMWDRSVVTFIPFHMVLLFYRTHFFNWKTLQPHPFIWKRKCLSKWLHLEWTDFGQTYIQLNAFLTKNKIIFLFTKFV